MKKSLEQRTTAAARVRLMSRQRQHEHKLVAYIKIFNKSNQILIFFLFIRADKRWHKYTGYINRCVLYISIKRSTKIICDQFIRRCQRSRHKWCHIDFTSQYYIIRLFYVLIKRSVLHINIIVIYYLIKTCRGIGEWYLRKGGTKNIMHLLLNGSWKQFI